jgi:hypothetical protein
LNIKDFISESLYQIAGGIDVAQKRIAEEFDSKIEPKPTDDYHNVYFDIALTVIEEEADPTCSRLLVMGLSHLGVGSFEQMLSLVSRVKFSVPLSYAQTAKDKYPSYLHFSTH